MVLDLDLNDPPFVEDIIPLVNSESVSLNLAMGLGLSGIEVGADLEPIDDEVVICSPRSFAEARDKSRRHREVIEVVDVETEFQLGLPESTARLSPSSNHRRRAPPQQRTAIYDLCINLEADERTKGQCMYDFKTCKQKRLIRFSSSESIFGYYRDSDLLSLHQRESENNIKPPELPHGVVSPQTPNFSCPVCMGPFSEETSTKCGHIFCKGCIDTAIEVQKKCPTCRRKLKPKDTFRIYLPASE